MHAAPNYPPAGIFTLPAGTRIFKIHSALLPYATPNPRPWVYTAGMAIEPHRSELNYLRISRRPLFMLIAAALLHLMVIGWLGGMIDFPAIHPPQDSSLIVATLEAPPQPAVKAAVKPPSRTSRPPAARPSVASTMPVVLADLETSNADVQADAAPDTAPPFDNAEASAPTAASEANSTSYSIDLPPSADLKYDVQKTPKDGAPMYGSGTIKWQTDGSTYSVNGDFGVLFITALHFQSSGSINDSGIVPELYSEKRFRKPQTNTHFHRERNTISFSSSTLSYPRTGGEQDRASIMWQLAGIGRGDSGKFVAGSSIDLFVAGTRNAETWKILIIGQEEITIDGVITQTWHVVRAPRNDTHDQRLDIWLAPDRHWYPVRLRYTESNGDFLDMTLTGLNVSAIH